MFRKTAVIMAAIMTLSILVSGCGINKAAYAGVREPDACIGSRAFFSRTSSVAF